jgi:glycosyltransferase involved in cell wall biosynthesis
MTLDLSKAPLITVVIPTYNHALYLGEAITSVFNQTYTNWELLVIDNHSSDDTDKVLAEFSNLRMSVFKVNNNGSIALSRNIGSAHAKGEWIAFLDSDDYWTKNKLQVCSKFFAQGIDLIYHDLKIIDKNSKLQENKKIKSRQVKIPVTLDLLLKGNTIATSSVVVRKSGIDSVGGMSEAPELRGIEDYNTWLKISKRTEGFKHIQKALGYYRIHETNISNMNTFAPPRAAIAEFLPTLSQKQRQQIEINFLYTGARLNYLSGNHSEAKNGLKKVIRTKHLTFVIKSLWMLFAEYQFDILQTLRRK